MGTIQLEMDFLLVINNILLDFSFKSNLITWYGKNQPFKLNIKDYTMAIQLEV